MRSRLAGRLVTGPFAFLLAGVIDVAVVWTLWAWQRIGVRVARRPML